jgi:hypothetical protein
MYPAPATQKASVDGTFRGAPYDKVYHRARSKGTQAGGLADPVIWGTGREKRCWTGVIESVGEGRSWSFVSTGAFPSWSLGTRIYRRRWFSAGDLPLVGAALAAMALAAAERVARGLVEAGVDNTPLLDTLYSGCRCLK